MDFDLISWLSQTIFFSGLFFILLIFSKIIFKWHFRKIDTANELTSKDNFAFSSVAVGYFFGIVVIFLGVLQGESLGYALDAASILSYGILGNFLLILSSLLNDKVIFGSKVHFHKEIFKDENTGAGIVEGANYLGSAFLIYGAITGQSPSFFPELGLYGSLLSGICSTILLWGVGQLILGLILKGYTRFSSYQPNKEIERDNTAAGIVYASVFLATALLYSHAIKADVISWWETGENLIYDMALGLILLPVSRKIVDKIILPKSNLKHEIIDQEIPNNGAALIEAFAYIGSALILCYCI